MSDIKNGRETKLNTIEEAIADIKAGKVVIVVDDENRENEGDFVAAAEMATPELINFMALHGRGLICTPITESRSRELKLDLMVGKHDNTDPHGTAFTVSIDKIGDGVTTGISASDRSKTVKSLVDPTTRPEDLGRPGHIFPLKAREGGVLRRTGHTEAAIDLARLAGLAPAGVIVEIMNEDGTMARLPQLMEVAAKHDLKIVSIEDLVAYRMKHDSLIVKKDEFELETRFGKFTLHAFLQTTNDQVHLALTKGSWTPDEEVTVRVHAMHASKDPLMMLTRKNDDYVKQITELIDKEGKGAIVIINQPMTSVQILSRLQMLKEDHTISDENTKVKLDEKDFGIGAQIIHNLGIKKLRMITRLPIKRTGITGYGLEITSSVQY